MVSMVPTEPDADPPADAGTSPGSDRPSGKGREGGLRQLAGFLGESKAWWLVPILLALLLLVLVVLLGGTASAPWNYTLF